MSKSTPAAPPTPPHAPASFEVTEELSEKHGPDIGSTSESEEDEATLDGSESLLGKHRADVEAQGDASGDEASEKIGAPVPTEYRVSTKRKLTYLATYFLFNLGLTIYNKAVLGKVRHFDSRSYPCDLPVWDFNAHDQLSSSQFPGFSRLYMLPPHR